MVMEAVPDLALEAEEIEEDEVGSACAGRAFTGACGVGRALIAGAVAEDTCFRIHG